jgi:glutamate dehydrogenase
MLKILDREYGSMVRVVGMADGSGCAEDPQGLPMAELLRLFELGLPLCDLRAEQLGPQGAFHSAEHADGAAKRNSMHNRVQADVFVTGGGRPSTINGSNWRDFLLPDGTPSARTIVEGANLFVTHEARQALFEHCALPIVKDSSANKCGVICSSMEIVAGMLLDDKEFIALKPEYVPGVLDILRSLARSEAQLLFAEARKNPDVSMPQLSESISRAILRVSDAAASQFEGFAPEQKGRLWPLTREHLPAPLFDGYASRIAARLPWEYTKNMIASSLASRIVYREGLQYVDGLPDATLPQVCLRYMQEEKRVRELAEEVGASGMENADQMKELLLQGGVRAAVERGL